MRFPAGVGGWDPAASRPGLAAGGFRVGLGAGASGRGWRLATPTQAVWTAAASCRPSSSMAASRILYFWILPVMVIGKSSVTCT